MRGHGSIQIGAFAVNVWGGYVTKFSHPIFAINGNEATLIGFSSHPIAFGLRISDCEVAIEKEVPDLIKKYPRTPKFRVLGVRPAGFDPNAENADLTPDPKWQL